MTQKRCFVVMGFGIKTDLATGRKLNLDKSYQALIKPVVESKGMICLRADEIKHSGSIDLQMYQQLLSADIVVADLSTSNVNAFYELGVRHALKPKTTIIISEELLGYPFDVNHIAINRYTHLGDSIDYFEVLRFQKLLGETIDSVLNSPAPDSPVYTFISELIPPFLQSQAKEVVNHIGEALMPAAIPPSASDKMEDQSLSILISQAEDALRKKQFDTAKALFETALRLCNADNDPHQVSSNNTYLVQRLALATYQARQPDYITSLKNALALLEKIDLARTNDPETVALAGSIEKHLFEEAQGTEHLDNAILFFQRGYYLLHNRHNGINLAYLLHLRSVTTLTDANEKMADLVWANRIRKEVLELCKRDTEKIAAMEDKVSASNTNISEEQKEIINDQKFWIAVNKAEAHFGLRQMPEYEAAAAAAQQIDHEEWMMDSFTKQLEKLGMLMKNSREPVHEESTI